MAFLEPAPATEAVTRMYAEDEALWGFLPNFAHTYSLNPEVYQAWKGLNGAIKATMDFRRYEVATVAAAAELRSSYCSLAHGRILADRFLPPEAVAGLAADDEGPGAELTKEDLAIAAFARKIVRHADQVTAEDVDSLRAVGLTDAEIFSVALAASARCFFSKSLDATGTTPDTHFMGMPPALRDALTVGRPIDQQS